LRCVVKAQSLRCGAREMVRHRTDRIGIVRALRDAIVHVQHFLVESE
jgi:hypothetical protein